MAIILLALPSCRSHSVVQRGVESCRIVQNGVAVVHSVDTVVVHDSVFVSERQKGDTIYLSRTEYRDRWRTRLVHDTVRHTEYVDRVLEKPPERYVPKFYKWSTAILWLLVIVFVAYLFLRSKIPHL